MDTMTPSQQADVAAAFEALSEETKGKFEKCRRCGGTGKTKHPQKEPVGYFKVRPLVEVECKDCDGTGRCATSDRAMEILDEMGVEYRLSQHQVVCERKHHPPIRFLKCGSSPLHALLLAIKKIGG